MLNRKSTVNGHSRIIAIGYKYYTRKVLYFIATEETCITKDGITYFSEYPDQFSDVSICPVDVSLFMSKLFGSVNEVD